MLKSIKMAKTNKILGVLALLGMVFGSTQVFAAYTIDGDLSDWGIGINGVWSQNSTWLSNSGVSFVVEDNKDPQYNVNPMGVHIKGTGHAYSTYYEDMITLFNGVEVIEPYGGEEYDIEALYMDQDTEFLYVAIVTSVPPNDPSNKAQDLALNIDKNMGTGEYGYEYGVKLGSITGGVDQFGIYFNPDWLPGHLAPDVKPTMIDSGTKVGTAQGVYSDSGIMDNGKTNYIIELAIPKSALGNPAAPVSLYDMFIAEYCGNDHIPTASEFPILITGALLLASPAFAYLLAKKKQKN